MTTHTVCITGAAGHLGQAVAATFLKREARLVLIDRDGPALDRIFGGTAGAMLLPLDLLDREQVHGVLGQAIERHGAVDVCCHLAGGFRMGEAVHQTTAATFDFLMDLNAKSLLNIAGAVVPPMCKRRRGRIVTVGAAAAGRGTAQMGAYAASKSALMRLTEAMSAELKDQGINVNCVLPSIIDTPDNRIAMPDADASRWVSPQALADVIAFLASDGARSIHGAAIPVTGLTG